MAAAMKQGIVLAIALVPCFRSPSQAQSPSAYVNVAAGDRVAIKATNKQAVVVSRQQLDQAFTLRVTDTAKAPVTRDVGPTEAIRNPYVGAQLGYSLNNTGDFASNLVASGSAMYTVIAPDPSDTALPKFFLPVRGNFAGLSADSATRDKQVQKLVSSERGLRVGMEPYVVLRDWGRYVHPVLFGSAGWKITSEKDKTDTTRYITVGRLSTGFELGLGLAGGDRLPVVVDVAPVYSIFADRNFRAVLGEDFPRALWSIESTLVVPTGTNMGVLSEMIAAQRTRPMWRIGVILVATK